MPSASPGGLAAGWGLYTTKVPIAPNQVTAILTTLGSFGRKDITISGGALQVDLAVSATDGLARYERLEMRTNYVEQTIDGDFSPALGQPPQPVKLSLALGAIVTMRRPPAICVSCRQPQEGSRSTIFIRADAVSIATALSWSAIWKLFKRKQLLGRAHLFGVHRGWHRS